MSRGNHLWLKYRDDPVDLGPEKSPRFPYRLYRRILSPTDCRCAVIDETEPLENEFGRESLRPLYRLLWLLNRGDAVKTTHLIERRARRAQNPPGYDWARENVGVNIILHSGYEHEWLDNQVADALKFELLNLLASSPPAPNATSRGWYLGVTTIRIYHYWQEDVHSALGVELQTSGFAGTRHRAGQRWAAMIRHVAKILESHQRETRAAGA